MRLDEVMLTTEELARLFKMSQSTVLRQIHQHGLPAEPKLGRPTAGYLIMPDRLVAWLRERQLDGQARAVEQYVAGLPEDRGIPAQARGFGRPPARDASEQEDMEG